MADSKQHATAIAVSLALLATGERAVAQKASEMEARLEAGALTTSMAGNALPLSALALTPGIRYADKRVTLSRGDRRFEAWEKYYHAIGSKPVPATARSWAFPTEWPPDSDHQQREIPLLRKIG